jgi:stage V sporulation protein D (sporulation-specific penicillin-binding protein)
MRRRRLARRTRVVLGLAALWVLWLVWRVVDVQVVQAAWLTAQARQIHLHVFQVPAPRGDILDAEGVPLAVDVPAYDVVAAPAAILQVDPHDGPVITREADLLARWLPFSSTLIRQVLSRSGWYQLIARDVTPGTARHIAAALGVLPGISLIPTEERLYPAGSLAAQVVGFVGAGDRGMAGIEYSWDRWLAGRAGEWIVDTDANGNPLPAWQVREVPPTPGDSVQLTVNSQIQLIAERALQRAMHLTRARNGTVIIMNPHSGAILALANAPSFNPNQYWNASDLAFTNWAVADPVPPGSIFKPVTASAALTYGLVTPDTMFDTVGYKIVDGVRINDWNLAGWGWIPFKQAFALSSDQVFMDLGLELGTARLYRFIRAFGLMHPSGVGLPGDSDSLFIPPSQVNAVDLATIAFGQGMAVTPLQMVTAIAAIANDGTLMRPRIVQAVLAPDGRVVKRYPPMVEGHPVSIPVAQIVQGLMEREVQVGTGIKAQVPGYIMAGKTGTAQKIVDGRTSTSQYVSSFVGYGPMPDPRFVMLVMLNQPQGLYYGGDVAAPVFGQIAAQLMKFWHIPPRAGSVH